MRKFRNPVLLSAVSATLPFTGGIMKHPWKILAATLGLILVPALSATLASAQCGAPAIKASFNVSPFVAGAHFKTAAFLKTNDHDDWREASLEPIVGLWKISF